VTTGCAAALRCGGRPARRSCGATWASWAASPPARTRRRRGPPSGSSAAWRAPPRACAPPPPAAPPACARRPRSGSSETQRPAGGNLLHGWGTRLGVGTRHAQPAQTPACGSKWREVHRRANPLNWNAVNLSEPGVPVVPEPGQGISTYHTPQLARTSAEWRRQHLTRLLGLPRIRCAVPDVYDACVCRHVCPSRLLRLSQGATSAAGIVATALQPTPRLHELVARSPPRLAYVQTHGAR
jgi:hypothetical protein